MKSRLLTWLGLGRPAADPSPTGEAEPVSDAEDAAEIAAPTIEAWPLAGEPATAELAPDEDEALPPGVLLLRALYTTATDEQRRWLTALDQVGLERWVCDAEVAVLLEQPQLLAQAISVVRAGDAAVEAERLHRETYLANVRGLQYALGAYAQDRARGRASTNGHAHAGSCVAGP